MLKNYGKAFTLVELLVVIAIVGLLSTIVLAVTSGVSEQGRIAKGLQFSKHLENSLGDHLVGRWTFDETADLCGTDKVCDTSGWDNHGTLINSPTWRCANDNSSYTPSGQGCSIQFDGVDDYVSVGYVNKSILQPNHITLSVWSYNSSGYFLMHGEPVNRNTSGYCLSTSSFNVITADGSKFSSDFSASIPQNKWVFIVATWDGNTMEVYVDGTNIYSAVKGGGDIIYNVGRGIDSFFMHKYTYADLIAGSGITDEVRIYNTALTVSQIRSQYYAGLNRLLVEGLIDEEEYQSKLMKI
jgi:prepilin-type N-terminal cleavage/methylation domain-containing protein